MHFEVPRETVLPVDRVDVRLDPEPHPFERENRTAIDANWAREHAANPSLFDGAISLLSRLSLNGRRLEGVCHPIRFATFLYWRRTRPWPTAAHSFAHAMPVTSDGALVAVRMAATTANPGKVYFAAGSFEPQDFPDGRVDVDANMAREVAEETGLAIAGLPRDPHYHIWSMDAGTVIFRRYRLAMTAREAEAAIRAHVASEKDPEIAGPVMMHGPSDLPVDAMPYMRQLVGWHFEQAAAP